MNEEYLLKRVFTRKKVHLCKKLFVSMIERSLTVVVLCGKHVDSYRFVVLDQKEMEIVGVGVCFAALDEASFPTTR